MSQGLDPRLFFVGSTSELSKEFPDRDCPAMFVASALLSTAARANGRPRLRRLRRAAPVLPMIQAIADIAFYTGINEKVALVETAQQQVVMELVSESSYTWYLPDATLKEVAPRGARMQAGGAAGRCGRRSGRGTSRRPASAAAKPSQGSTAAGGHQGEECRVLSIS